VVAEHTADGILPQELNETPRITMHLQTEAEAWLPTKLYIPEFFYLCYKVITQVEPVFSCIYLNHNFSYSSGDSFPFCSNPVTRHGFVIDENQKTRNYTEEKAICFLYCQMQL
jgi:hypothetical protein